MAYQQMTTISRYFFGDSDKTAFSVSIVENLKEDYGLFVWPCSIVLAEFVWQQRYGFSGNDVVELGAGTCLPGLIASKVGSNVTLTDDANRSEVPENMRTVRLNCSQPRFCQAPFGGVKWSGFGRELGEWGLENYSSVKQVTEYVSDEQWGLYEPPKQ